MSEQPTLNVLTERDDVRAIVRQKYGQAALMVLQGQGAACCGGNSGGGSSSCCDPNCCTGDSVSPGRSGETRQEAAA